MAKRLHGGVRGAHPSQGGIPTPLEDMEGGSREHLFGSDARFVQGPEGRDSMWAGDSPAWSQPKPHVDTAPYRRRPASQGDQLPLATGHDDPAFQPTDIAQHVVRLKHPHLGNDYQLARSGNDIHGHEVTAYHQGQTVGYLRWNGSRHNSSMGQDAKPGEIEGVSVHPDHRGKELSTAMWDYAQIHVAQHGIQAPIHSSDRSTAGNHWAHFVGGAAYARQEGADHAEYFQGEWH
jgi:hypothetical protein